jgi:hypothetical protein
MKKLRKVIGIDHVYFDGIRAVDKDGKRITSNRIKHGEHETTVTMDWLDMFSKFKISFLKKYFEYIPMVEFYKHKREHRYEAYTIRFKRPVSVGNGFRLIARYPRYAVNNKGDVLSLRTGKIRTRDASIAKGTTGSYPHIYIYDGRMGYSVKVYLHILVATQWVDNKDWNKSVIVNHIDGNKFNPSYDNLEWLSYSENTKHYYEVLAGNEQRSNVEILGQYFL